MSCVLIIFFFFQAEDGIRDYKVTGVQTCALPIWKPSHGSSVEHGTTIGGRSGSLHLPRAGVRGKLERYFYTHAHSQRRSGCGFFSHVEQRNQEEAATESECGLHVDRANDCRGDHQYPGSNRYPELHELSGEGPAVGSEGWARRDLHRSD